MSGLMTSFSVGVTGLKSAQTGVNTTSHNLVNVNTEGYSRQRVNTTDRVYNTVGSCHVSLSQIGLGSEVNRISQVRDVFFDKAYRLEVGRQSFYQVQSEATAEVEDLMGEMEGAEFQETLTELWKTMEELVKEPDSRVKRESMINTANMFLTRAQDVYSQLSSYQDNLNKQVKDAVKEVNEIGHKIYELNKKIVKAESGQEIANDYRDMRNVLLDELAQYASISYHEDVDGRVMVSVEGTMFVGQDFVFEMKTEKNEENNLVNVVWGEGVPVFNLDQGFSSELDTDVGKLKSLLFARGDGTGNYSDIPEEAEYDYDGGDVLYKQVMKEFNQTTNSSVIKSTQAYLDKLVHSVVTAVNDALSPNATPEVALKKLGIDVNKITDVEIAGVSYKINRNENTGEVTVTDNNNNEVPIKNILILDEFESGVGMDGSTIGVELFSRQSVERYTEATITVDGKTKTIYIYNEEQKKDLSNPDDYGDTYSLYTIDQLVINQDVLDNSTILPLSGNNYKGNAGGYDPDACERLSSLWQDTGKMGTLDPNTTTKYNIVDYYNALVGNIATIGQEYSSKVKTQESLVNSIEDNRSSVAGVSSDEELTNLIMYQYAYTASSKYITTVDQMLADLLNKLG